MMEETAEGLPPTEDNLDQPAAVNGASAPPVSEDGLDQAVYDEPSEDDARLIELVGFLVQGIVSRPDEVEVEEFYDDIGVVYGVRVDPEDVGRVIGKDGRVANALRQVVKAAATKIGTHVTVEIMTDDEPLEDADKPEDVSAAPESDI